MLWYGMSLGLLLAALEVLQYKWVFMKNAVEWYSGMIAVLFTVIGIWAGSRFGRKKNGLSRAGALETLQQPADADVSKYGITPREMEVLQLMALGHSNREIANQLYVSLNTVKTHISNVLSKLNAERRTQAIRNAKSLGILP